VKSQEGEEKEKGWTPRKGRRKDDAESACVDGVLGDSGTTREREGGGVVMGSR
jgi:hypothetical protein